MKDSDCKYITLPLDGVERPLKTFNILKRARKQLVGWECKGETIFIMRNYKRLLERYVMAKCRNYKAAQCWGVL